VGQRAQSSSRRGSPGGSPGPAVPRATSEMEIEGIPSVPSTPVEDRHDRPAIHLPPLSSPRGGPPRGRRAPKGTPRAAACTPQAEITRLTGHTRGRLPASVCPQVSRIASTLKGTSASELAGRPVASIKTSSVKNALHWPPACPGANEPRGIPRCWTG
jgi:hypothetical protein